MPRSRSLVRVAWPRWPAAAWASIGVCALFIAITCWWLTQDRGIPLADAGFHLNVVLEAFAELKEGRLLHVLTIEGPYPPFVYLVGSLGLFIGGVEVASPILAQNLIFVPLLALGCYKVGKLAFSPSAGLLAVVFALGSPLIAEQFHVFMIDAPETAMVAVSVWAIIATEGFSRLRVCALAGLVVGLGLMTKEPVAFFLVGVLLVTIVRGGRRAWRGLAIFAVVALAIALPWYVYKLSQINALESQAVSAGSTGANSGNAPARFSSGNLEWYFWTITNYQLFVPLFVFSAVGGVWTAIGFLRRRWVSPLAPELMLGACLGWFAITETFVHDSRYSMPLLVYFAVFASGWIVRLPGRGRIVASTALVLVAVLNTLVASIGVGGTLETKLPLPGGVSGVGQVSGVVTIYSTKGYVVGGPKRDGDILAMLRALRRNGVRTILLLSSPKVPASAAFAEGLVPLSKIAALGLSETSSLASLDQTDAVLDREQVKSGETTSPPCVKLDDGTGVWVRLGNPEAPGVRDYCPLPHPRFYEP
jgi:hypothetical protein